MFRFVLGLAALLAANTASAADGPNILLHAADIG